MEIICGLSNNKRDFKKNPSLGQLWLNFEISDQIFNCNRFLQVKGDHFKNVKN